MHLLCPTCLGLSMCAGFLSPSLFCMLCVLIERMCQPAVPQSVLYVLCPQVLALMFHKYLWNDGINNILGIKVNDMNVLSYN